MPTTMVAPRNKKQARKTKFDRSISPPAQSPTTSSGGTLVSHLPCDFQSIPFRRAITIEELKGMTADRLGKQMRRGSPIPADGVAPPAVPPMPAVPHGQYYSFEQDRFFMHIGPRHGCVHGEASVPTEARTKHASARAALAAHMAAASAVQGAEVATAGVGWAVVRATAIAAAAAAHAAAAPATRNTNPQQRRSMYKTATNPNAVPVGSYPPL